MNDLYYVKEPRLYSMGLYLENENPAKFVAEFNGPSEEARRLTRFGFALLEGTRMFAKRFPEISRTFPAAKSAASARQTTLHRQCPRKVNPECPAASLRYRTSDGSCNNLRHLWWGSAMSTMQRFLPAVYEDGIQSVRRSRNGQPLPSAREVSSVLHADRDVPLASVTHMLMQWGQLVDHDVTATAQSRGFNGTVPRCCLAGGAGFQPPDFMHPDCLPISVSPRDGFYGPLGVRCLEFVRSGPAPREGCDFGPREQLSQVTSYLDASTVYSSNAAQSDGLRLFRNGLLRYGRIDTGDEADLCRRGSLATSCFQAGDGRSTEQPALTSLHVVLLRLHNALAGQFAELNRHWSDERLFQESRRVVAAVVQHITYREFLPIVLGPRVARIFDLELLPRGYYRGYDPSVDPTVSNAFSSAAYRFGHSLVQRSFLRYDEEHRLVAGHNATIHEESANPGRLASAGALDRLLLGLANEPSQRRDEYISSELTRHLFQGGRSPFGMDLAALNVQRGRDHGIPAYVDWREPCGLSAIRNFADLGRALPASAVRKFRSLYASVDDIDLFSAGLAESSVSGGLVGPTFACIIAQQFANLRRGDRFWYENPPGETAGFTPGQLRQLRRVSLAQLLCRTIDSVRTIQPFVLLMPDELRNRRVTCDDELIGQIDLSPWQESGPDPGSDQARTKLFPTAARPSIHQQNRIIVRGPLSGLSRPDNFTIVVQNNAINSPVIVNDAIVGSHVNAALPSVPLFDRYPPTTPRAAPYAYYDAATAAVSPASLQRPLDSPNRPDSWLDDAPYPTGDSRPTRSPIAERPVYSHSSTRRPPTEAADSPFESHVSEEIPRPLTSDNHAHVGKPGQYYYVRNVLRRYPDDLNGASPTGHTEAVDDDRRDLFPSDESRLPESSFLDEAANAHVVRNDNTRLVTTPTFVLDDPPDNSGHVDRHIHRTNGLTGTPNEERTEIPELPRPMMLRRRAS